MGNDLVPPEDAEIIEHMNTGVESAKEAADVEVARMLEEEAKNGRGTDRFDEDGRLVEGEVEAEPEDKELPKKADAEETPKKPEETESQRRRRLRKEGQRKLRERNTALEAENRALRERIQHLDENAPRPEDYGEDRDTYIADRAAYAAERTQHYNRYAANTKAVEQGTEQVKSAATQDIQDFLNDGDKRHEGFAAKITSPDFSLSPAMVELLLEEGDHDLAWHLVNNPSKSREIAMMDNPIQQTKALLKEQAALQAKAADAKVTKAPEPMKPLRGAGAAREKSPSEMTYSEYVKYRQKQSG